MISKKALLSLSLGALLLGGTITASASTNNESATTLEIVKPLKVKMYKLKDAQSKQIVDFKNVEAIKILNLKDFEPMKIVNSKDIVKAELIQPVKVEGIVKLPSGEIIKIENAEKLIEKLNLEKDIELQKVKNLLESGEVEIDAKIIQELESEGILKKLALKKIEIIKSNTVKKMKVIPAQEVESQL